jgi:putative FmdB family regulatory protein
MPTYEYKCTKCGHTFEEFQQITAEPLTSCPQCKGSVKRVLTGGAGFILNGPGFYSTDYRETKEDTCCSRGESCANPKRCCEK